MATLKLSEVQQIIFSETGINTNVTKCVGSMRGYYCFKTILPLDSNQELTFEWQRKFMATYQYLSRKNIYASDNRVHIFEDALEIDKPMRFRRPSVKTPTLV